MDQEEAAAILTTLRSELFEARRAVDNAQRRANSLAKLIEGYIELFPGLAEPSGPVMSSGAESPELGPVASPQDLVDDRPRGQEAVLRILKALEFRGRFWTVSQMAAELGERGWLPEPRSGDHEDYDPTGAVRVSLDRLANTDARVHKGRGRHNNVVFFYRHEGMEVPTFQKSDRLARDRHLLTIEGGA